MHEDPDDAFGFKTLTSLKDRVKQIRPSITTEAFPDLARVDAVADSVGFVSREAFVEPVQSYRATRAKPEPRIPLNMRVPVSLGNAFQRFCEQERYSYTEALAEVMRRAGLPLK